MTMDQQVKSAKVTGRRELHFSRIDEAFTDAEALAAAPHTQLGNWTLGEICDHLAKSLDTVTDDKQFQPGLFFKLIGPLLRNRMINHPMSPGFQMPAGMKPIFMPTSDADTSESLPRLRKAIERFNAADLPERSPTFGKMSQEDWHKFHCRHAEMHLSFIVPAIS